MKRTIFPRIIAFVLVLATVLSLAGCGIITIKPARPGGLQPTRTPAPASKPTPTPQPRYTVHFDSAETFETEAERRRAQHIDPHIKTAVKVMNTIPADELNFEVKSLDHSTLPTERDKITNPDELYIYDLICETARQFGNFKINAKSLGLTPQEYNTAFFSAVDKYHTDYKELYMYADLASDAGYDRLGYYIPGKWLDRQTNDITAVKAELDRYYRIIDRIIEKMPQGMTNREKCYYFAFLIASCNRYDYSLRTKSHTYPAYACLADGLSVCSGYADAFYVLCRHEGIYCVTDAGYSPEQDPANPYESHVWNLLQTDDGPIYVDLTWYDSREPDTYNSYRDGWFGYLMMTEEKLHDYGYIRYANISQ